MIKFVVRTHEDHWDNNCVVAVFYSLYDAFEYVRLNFDCNSTDCYSISKEDESDE